jgi:hypothetical protein
MRQRQRKRKRRRARVNQALIPCEFQRKKGIANHVAYY